MALDTHVVGGKRRDILVDGTTYMKDPENVHIRDHRSGGIT